jgi:hypothetical protein
MSLLIVAHTPSTNFGSINGEHTMRSSLFSHCCCFCRVQVVAAAAAAHAPAARQAWPTAC